MCHAEANRQPRNLLALIRAAFAEADEIGKEADELLAEVSAMSDADVEFYLKQRGLMPCP